MCRSWNWHQIEWYVFTWCCPKQAGMAARTAHYFAILKDSHETPTNFGSLLVQVRGTFRPAHKSTKSRDVKWEAGVPLRFMYAWIGRIAWVGGQFHHPGVWVETKALLRLTSLPLLKKKRTKVHSCLWTGMVRVFSKATKILPYLQRLHSLCLLVWPFSGYSIPT